MEEVPKFRSVMDVIVIGCGPSGIAALRRLHDAGIKTLGLEASNRIGGRIRSEKYGAYHLDLGAAWYHGGENNIVFEMANSLGLLAASEPDNKYFLLSNGDLLPTDRGEKLVDVIDEAIEKADKNNTKSISEYVHDVAKSNETLKKDPKLMNSLIEFYQRNNHLGGQKDPKKGKSLKGLEECWMYGKEKAIPYLNWTGRGYKTVLDLLMNKIPDATKELPIPIHFNKEVENIKWCTSEPNSQRGNPLVQIKCKDGSLYASKSVIVTISLGVLKERHNQLFSPQLPSEKINSINNIEFCILDKIYIEFTEPWWPNFPTNFNILWRDEDKAKFESHERWLTEISVFNTVGYQPNLLLATLYGEGAKEMEKVSENEVKDGIEKLLRILFSNNFKLSPVKSILRSQWAFNPLTRGSYSYRSVNTEENGASAIALSQPLFHDDSFPVVCFAGEATSHHRHNSTHGAIEAGFREADRLLASFKEGTI